MREVELRFLTVRNERKGKDVIVTGCDKRGADKIGDGKSVVNGCLDHCSA